MLFEKRLPFTRHVAQLPQATAEHILSNVLAACGRTPNSVPLEALTSYSNYRKERYALQRSLILLVLVLFLLLPLLFIAASISVTQVNPDSGETLIEYNDVHDVCKCTSDSGAIYLGRRWDWAGNVIRYNYIHDIIDVAHNGTPLGIYLDDQVSGQHVYSNLLVNVSGNAIGVCSGKYNIVENNIIVNCKNVPISNDQRGLGFAANHCSYPTGYMWGTMLGTEPYSKFMALARPENLLHVEAVKSSIYNIDDPGICSYTVIRDNVSYGDYEIEVYDEIEYSDLYKDELPFDGITSLIPMMRLYNTYEGNEYYPVGTDIGFVDEENSNYFLRDDSRVYRDIPGFEKIQFDKIGIID